MRPALIIGGAGFVGANLADRLLRDGERVVILDALVRRNVEQNLAWLQQRHGDRLQVVVEDVRKRPVVRELCAGASRVFHLAAQVAVTTSLADPLGDFEVNAWGTLVVLDAIRRLPDPPPLVFTSTNKVYGDLEDVALVERDGRWEPADERLARRGIDEQRPLSFHSPYGCSKGAADQYVLDHARTFGLPATVLRMSCIYGPRQFGTEDQGWLAHFLLQARRGRPITVYGDGKQVRDVLFVEDLVEAMLACGRHVDRVRGRAFNLGGGPERTLSLRELLAHIQELGLEPIVEHGPWRAADQRWYVSDPSAFAQATGWSPRVAVAEGLGKLDRWLREVR